LRAIVFAVEPLDLARVQRTLRSLRAAEVHATLATDMAVVAAELNHAKDPLWLVRSGSWQPCPKTFRTIPSSTSGKPLIGLCRKDANSVYVEPEPARILACKLKSGTRWFEAINSLRRIRSFRTVPLHDIDVQFDPALRIVQLVTTIQLGGAERVTLDLAHECNRTGIPTVVAALGEPTRKGFATPRHFADLSEIPHSPAERAKAVERLCL
jgi:hypothetical protein